MSQPIALGAVLGGRYKVSAFLLSTPEDDHVLQGEDQILRRRVSILVPATAHESTVVDSARALAAGAGHSGFQVLDMGQTEDATYLVTSYAPAPDLLEALLFSDEDADDYSLSDDIFGDPRTASSSSYIYQEPDPTQPQQRVDRDEETSGTGSPAVTRWAASDYDDYDGAPAAPSVRNRLGIARRVRPDAVRSTLFDRAAARSGAGSAAVTAGDIDPTYDGDNRYDSYERTEGKPDRLDDRAPSSRPVPDGELNRPVTGEDGTGGTRTDGLGTSGPGADEGTAADPRGEGPGFELPQAFSSSASAAAPVPEAPGADDDVAPLEAPGTTAPPRGGAPRPRHDEGATAAAAAGATGTGAAGTGSIPRASGATVTTAPTSSDADTDPGEADSAREEPAESLDDHGLAGATAAVAGGANHKGPLRWLLLLLLALLLVAAIVLGFRGLGSLTSQFAQQGGAQQSTAPDAREGSPAASGSPTSSATPRIAAVTRVTSDPGFMADTDATLNQATDGNPATYWLSYGFSNATFGNLADSVGLAVQLEEPATAQEVTLQQASGSGGQFTVYVSDQPTVQGAQEVGRGSFTGPEIRVPLSEAARSAPHRYVLVVWTELPQLTSPIGGYPYGLRIGEISVR